MLATSYKTTTCGNPESHNINVYRLGDTKSQYMTPELAEIWRGDRPGNNYLMFGIVHRNQTLWNTKTKLHSEIHLRELLTAIKDFELG
jgi:hypothetical protein